MRADGNWADIGTKTLARSRQQELSEGMGFRWMHGRSAVTPEVAKDAVWVCQGEVGPSGNGGNPTVLWTASGENLVPAGEGGFGSSNCSVSVGSAGYGGMGFGVAKTVELGFGLVLTFGRCRRIGTVR